MKMDELLTKITPLPWKWDGDDIWHIGHSYDDKDNPHSYSGIKADTRLHKSPILAANKEYIIAAANVLPKLVEHLNWLQNAMNRLDPKLNILSQPGEKMICGQSKQHIEQALKLATNLDSGKL